MKEGSKTMRVIYLDSKGVEHNSFDEAFLADAGYRGILFADMDGRGTSLYDEAYWIYTPKGCEDIREFFTELTDFQDFIDSNLFKFQDCGYDGPVWWRWNETKNLYEEYDALVLRELSELSKKFDQAFLETL